MRKYVPNVSSATVRNEMAALEEIGYLYHPHTSAGRVPSDLGYRYYVEWLMTGARLADDEQRLISHQFHQIELDVSEWMRLAAVILSSRVQNLVMVAPPIEQVSRFRHVDLVRIATGTALVVVVLRSGAVRQQVIRLPMDVSQETLGQLAGMWNGSLDGLSSAEMRRIELPAAYPELLDAVIRLLEDTDRHSATGTEDVHVEGLRYIASQPEFGTSDRLQPVVEALERHGVLNSLMEPLLSSEGVYVAIGQEQPLERLRECSVVVGRYGRAGEMLGVVGVIGPTRLPYWRAVPMVRYVAGMLDQLLEETFLS
jgi:heat-inducible transcriptional repressor